MEATQRWKAAVVHLECATDSVHFSDRIRQIERLQEQVRRGEITHEQMSEGLSGGSRDIRFNGTAIFVRHASRRFLVTARHVLWDDVAAKRELEEEHARVARWPEHLRRRLVQHAEERSLTRIFSIIFRVPTLDEALRTRAQPLNFLMNLGAGVTWMAPYLFSSPEIDLAVVSLDQRNKQFADELEREGYTAISSDEFADGPTAEGADVFTVGFPSATAIIGERRLHAAERNWSSSVVCVPTFAFGKVSMLHPLLQFFWCDMSIYPGNSGGPVIEKDRLVGIVSEQPAIPVEDGYVEGGTTRIPFAKAIRASHVRGLLDLQLQKDAGGP